MAKSGIGEEDKIAMDGLFAANIHSRNIRMHMLYVVLFYHKYQSPFSVYIRICIHVR